MSNTCLQAKTVHIAAGLGLTTFRASSGLLWRLKRRYSVGIRCGTNNPQKVPADYADQIMHYRMTIALCKAKKIDPSRIVNMDQTMYRIDIPPTHVNVRGAKTRRIKTTRAEKKGVIVALAAAAVMTKLPAAIIFKERGGVLGRVRRSLRVPSNVKIWNSTIGWVTATEYQH